jgi:soluble lytic murein transglycosylase-like protein
MMKQLVFLFLVIPGLLQAGVPIQAWEYQDQMSESAWNIFGPTAPVATLAAQIQQESGWKCSVVSWAGAQGCAQFMPGTAADMARRFPQFCAPADPFDPEWAFTCRDLYLRSLINEMRDRSMDECSNWAFGFKAYNGGLGWVRRDYAVAITAGANASDWRVTNQYNAGRKASAWKENTEYPIRIFKLMYQYESWGRSLSCPRTL